LSSSLVLLSSWLSQLDVALELDEPDELLLEVCQLIATGVLVVVVVEVLALALLLEPAVAEPELITTYWI
jgi:hypothetical protein